MCLQSGKNAAPPNTNSNPKSEIPCHRRQSGFPWISVLCVVPCVARRLTGVSSMQQDMHQTRQTLQAHGAVESFTPELHAESWTGFQVRSHSMHSSVARPLCTLGAAARPSGQESQSWALESQAWVPPTRCKGTLISLCSKAHRISGGMRVPWT